MSPRMCVWKTYSGKGFCDQCCGSRDSTDKEARSLAQGDLLQHRIVAKEGRLKNNNTKASSLMA